jgi:hypothetical protein
MKTIRLNWLTYDDAVRAKIPNIDGTLHRIVFQHSDATVAGANYDVTIEDETGADLLNGMGQNVSFNAVAEILPRFYTSGAPDGLNFTIPVISPAWIKVNAGGDWTNGQITLYVHDGYSETGGIV